jgi:HPt (histidine-containing phosphotransfer) domain-containing protein
MSIDLLTSEDQLDRNPDPSLRANAVNSPDASLDLSVLISFEEVQSDGEPDLIVELIDLYIADAELRGAVMRDALSKKDEPSLKGAAHSLRGSSANLGARQMAKICEELEHTDWSASFDSLEPLLRQLEQESARVCQVFLTERERRA